MRLSACGRPRSPAALFHVQCWRRSAAVRRTTCRGWSSNICSTGVACLDSRISGIRVTKVRWQAFGWAVVPMRRRLCSLICVLGAQNECGLEVWATPQDTGCKGLGPGDQSLILRVGESRLDLKRGYQRWLRGSAAGSARSCPVPRIASPKCGAGPPSLRRSSSNRRIRCDTCGQVTLSTSGARRRPAGVVHCTAVDQAGPGPPRRSTSQ